MKTHKHYIIPGVPDLGSHLPKQRLRRQGNLVTTEIMGLVVYLSKVRSVGRPRSGQWVVLIVSNQ